MAFAPLSFGAFHSGFYGYLSSLGLVMAISLLLSLLLAVSFTPLLCRRFARQHTQVGRIGIAVQSLTGWYRQKVRWVLNHKAIFIGAMITLLVGSGFLLSRVPSELMPASERRQLQMAIELPPGASTAAMMRKASEVSQFLTDKRVFPAIANHAVYVGDGGPRFILALNPPTPASHRAYAVLSLAPNATHSTAINQLRDNLQNRFPDVRFEPKRFSMGSSDSGVAIFRLTGNDREKQQAAVQTLLSELHRITGIRDVQSDAEGQILRLDVQVDQVRARAAGLSSDDIARALQVVLGGQAVSVFHESDATLPIIIRGPEALRTDPGQLAAIPIPKPDFSGNVPLGQVATVALRSQPSVVQHYDQQRAVTLSARHPAMTAQTIAERLRPAIEAIGKDGTVTIELGGEIEENVSANTAIAGLLPACVLAMFLIFMWHFESVRRSLIVLASIPFVTIGAALALTISGTTLTFVGTLGLLALAGIIVNNAVLLLDAIDELRRAGLPAGEAIERAAAKRLRPILMTTMVCVLGLIPLLLSGGIVWKSLSVVMIGGLALGSLITLGLIPALYAALYRVPSPRP